VRGGKGSGMQIAKREGMKEGRTSASGHPLAALTGDRKPHY